MVLMRFIWCFICAKHYGPALHKNRLSHSNLDSYDYIQYNDAVTLTIIFTYEKIYMCVLFIFKTTKENILGVGLEKWH